MLSKEFVLAGRAIFTLEVTQSFIASHPGCKPHYTFKVKHVPANPKYPQAWFASLLAGPDNTRDYQPIGIVNPDSGELRITRNSKFTKDTLCVRLLQRILARVWAGTVEEIEEQGFSLHNIGRCGRCGRELTVPSSILSGLGPECATKV